MSEISIKDFLKYIRRYIGMLVFFVLLACGSVFVYDKMVKQPIYQAQTMVIIARYNSADSSSGTTNDISASQKLIAAYGEIAKSELVLDKVINQLRLYSDVKTLRDKVTIKTSDDTAIITIAVKDSDAEDAAAIANKIVDVSTEEIQSIYKIGNITQLSVAAAPVVPINNTLTRDLVMSVTIVTCGIVGIAFLKFYLDKTIKYGEHIEKEIELPIAGVIPRANLRVRRMDDGSTSLVKRPMAAVSESFKILRTNLQFAVVSKKFKTLLVTSTNVGEGKTFVAVNLAVSFAQAGKKVVLVDCDLRSGNVARMFGLEGEKGLSEYLAGATRDYSNYIHTTDTKNLSVLASGRYASNPSELLSMRKVKELMKVLGEIYDIVIFDGTPVNGYADSIVMASYVDETLFVIKNASTNVDDFMAAKAALNKVGAKITGAVINKVESGIEYRIS